MDATRQFRWTVYCRIDKDGYIIDAHPMSLREAWYWYINGGESKFMACDALSMEHNSCILDFEDMTNNEESDLYTALYG